MFSLLMANCKKGDNETPTPAQTKQKFNISIAQLPGQSNVLDGLTAIVSIQSASGLLVVENQTIALSYNSGYVTDAIELPIRNYKLVKLVVKRGGGTIFACPYTGSNLAPQVSRPLAADFTLNNATTTTLAAEVLAIVATHTAEDFGYEGGLFDLPQDGLQDFVIDLKPIFQVGKIVYDSVPASVTITTYPLQGNASTQVIQIAAGGQKISFSKNALKYKLSVSKWDLTDEIELAQSDMKSQELYIGGSTNVAKKIKTETVFLQDGSKWLAKTRKEYAYDALGYLTRITHLSKAANGANVVDGTEEFSYYANHKVSEIRSNINGNTKTTNFWYKTDGKLERMKESNSEGEITATVSYLGQRGKTGITNNYQISAAYEYSNRYYKQYATAEMIGGNASSYENHTSHGDREETIVNYDFGINPYAHLGIPDFWLKNASRHNPLDKWSTYITHIPKHDAFKFSYLYDADGFPKEMITKYRVSNTATEAYTTKTVFTY